MNDTVREIAPDHLVLERQPIRCTFYSEEVTGKPGRFDTLEPWCMKFQLIPKCGNDINCCDVQMFAPDPRDGYR